MTTLAQRQRWTLLAGAASAVAAPLAERAVSAVWRLGSDEDPPTDPAGPDTSWGRAIAWTAASAVAVAVAQLVARRAAALLWRQATGTRPPAPRRHPRRRPRRGRRLLRG